MEIEPQDTAASDGIWAEHLPALRAFLAAGTQWRFIAMGEGRMRAVGLDYTGVEVALNRAGIETTPRIWRDMQAIEIAARTALNEG
ncbi:hypothetical protein E1B25_01550 [Antarcticimicrobium sediminis]|uniref:DUF1799 domain-containing protein n=1 Tax=Antarcticimicrobium sediminis TaxID=2546227 RepID=A0A4V2Z8Q8_9RHOB|nr:hypothetical protein E1B25_01550 [Antarcticimicrobium sediminis]